jgi:hypothetical protein
MAVESQQLIQTIRLFSSAPYGLSFTDLYIHKLLPKSAPKDSKSGLKSQ